MPNSKLPELVGPVLMLDPSNFTIPYDNLLCGGLTDIGQDLTLLGRAPRPGETQPSASIRFEPWYYQYSESLRQRLPRLYRGAKAIEHVANSYTLRRRIRAKRPAILHFQWMIIPSLEDRLFCHQSTGIPRVLTVHDSEPFHGTRVSRLQINGWLEALRNFDQLIVHTEHSVEKLVAMEIEEDRINVVEHGVLPIVPGPISETSKRTADFTNTPIRLLLFGHLKPYKGIAELLDAIAMLQPDVRCRIHVTIAGRPDDSIGDLQDCVQVRAIHDVVDLQLRFLSDDELHSLIEDADVLLFPYHMIDASGAFMAVLPYGKIVVASKLGIFDESLTDGVDALLVPPRDVGALASAITRLVDDLALRQHLSSGARLLADAIPSWRSIAAKTIDVYRRALTSTR